MATRVAESWLKDFPANMLYLHCSPCLGQDVHAQRQLPGLRDENVQGHEGQLVDTDQGKASRVACFEWRIHGGRSPRARSLECEEPQHVILRMDNAALPILRHRACNHGREPMASQESRVAVIGAKSAGNPLPSICLWRTEATEWSIWKTSACGWHA